MIPVTKHKDIESVIQNQALHQPMHPSVNLKHNVMFQKLCMVTNVSSRSKQVQQPQVSKNKQAFTAKKDNQNLYFNVQMSKRQII